MKTYNFTSQEWEHCLKVLNSLKNDPFDNPDNQVFGSLITKISKNAKKGRRKDSFQDKRERDLATVLDSEIAKNAVAKTALFSEGTAQEKQSYTRLNIPKNCYSCNESYVFAHSFYGRLCPACAETNYANRFETLDLSKRNVILTGGRVKIGYATALKLLRANANLIVTTRFPASALELFKKETDYELWKESLTVYGLDLRNLNAIHEFVSYYKQHFDNLDILINNAAQTIKYTDQYYSPLIQQEQQLLNASKETTRLIANSTPVTNTKNLNAYTLLKDVEINRFGQPVDHREKNSWNSTLEDISMQELIEVNLINQIAPYFLIKELLPKLENSSFEKKYIINVTSSEGQFSYNNKTVFHPHTNMTKAALNMMTRTSAKQFEDLGIYMSAVDVGWVSTGATEELRKKQFERRYVPPLDPVDGASRILHPILEAEKNNVIFSGVLLKNYIVENW